LHRDYESEAKNIGIIAPYKAQKLALREKFSGPKFSEIEISTIDGFQVVKRLKKIMHTAFITKDIIVGPGERYYHIFLCASSK